MGQPSRRTARNQQCAGRRWRGWPVSRSSTGCKGLLEDEVTELLGRARYDRRGLDDVGYRNGYGKPRRLTTRGGTVTIRRPRARGLEYDSRATCCRCFRRCTPEVSYYRYPKEHWRHLRTTNVIESPFAALRLRTDAAKQFKKVANATVIWKMLGG